MMRFILFIFLSVMVSACSAEQQTPTKYITSDSTLVFTFVKDSLYVDVYESGCGIECYRLEVESKTDNETLYKGYEFILSEDWCDYETTHSIRLFKTPINSHWEYYIKFDDEEIIPIIKIN